MASRSIDALAPVVKDRALAFLRECKAYDIDAMIYCTLRTNDEQARLYAVGRTTPGQVLTNARPGASMHNPDKNGQAWAFDAVPVIAGKAMWDDVERLGVMGFCGEQVGLTWAGRWIGKLRERVHFEIERGEHA